MHVVSLNPGMYFSLKIDLTMKQMVIGVCFIIAWRHGGGWYMRLADVYSV